MRSKPLFFIALAGLVASLAVFIAAIAFNYDLTVKYPGLFVLHVGVFVVYGPAVFYLRKQLIGTRNKYGIIPIKVFKEVVFKYTPRWLVILFIVAWFGGIINFAFFAANNAGTPDYRNEKYILHNKGNIIREITPDEYMYYKSKATQSFAGIWIAFYTLSLALLYPFGKVKEEEETTPLLTHST